MQENTEKIWDIIIVGGGVAGLSAAHELSKFKQYKILVIERYDQLGGKLQSWHDTNSNLPYEHGYRFYMPFYQHLIIKLKEIGIWQNFRQVKPIPFLDKTKAIKKILQSIINHPFKNTQLFIKILRLIYSDTSRYRHVPPEEYFFELQNLTLLKIVEEMIHYVWATDKQRNSLEIYREAIKRSLQGMQWWMAPGPTHETVIVPWQDFLQKNGVEFMLQEGIKRVEEKGSIVELHLNNNEKKLKTRTVLLATTNIDAALIAKNSRLSGLEKCHQISRTSMHSVTLYLTATPNFSKLHSTDLSNFDNPWKISMQPYTRENWSLYNWEDIPEQINTILSCIFSCSDQAGFLNRAANACTESQLIDEIIAFLLHYEVITKKHLYLLPDYRKGIIDKMIRFDPYPKSLETIISVQANEYSFLGKTINPVHPWLFLAGTWVDNYYGCHSFMEVACITGENAAYSAHEYLNNNS